MKATKQPKLSNSASLLPEYMYNTLITLRYRWQLKYWCAYHLINYCRVHSSQKRRRYLLRHACCDSAKDDLQSHSIKLSLPKMILMNYFLKNAMHMECQLLFWLTMKSLPLWIPRDCRFSPLFFFHETCFWASPTCTMQWLNIIVYDWFI